MRKLSLSLSLGSLLLLTTACSAPVEDRFFWPIPPEEPRVEFIGHYSNPRDLTKGGFAQTLQGLSGGSEPLLHQPYGVAGDGRGKVYVAEGIMDRVRLLDFVEGAMKSVNQEFRFPMGLDVDSKGNIYVVNRARLLAQMKKDEARGKKTTKNEARVTVLSPEQIPLFSFGEGELKEPMFIAVDDERGRIYVSDQITHQVKVFNLRGQLIQTLGIEKPGGADGQFHRPQGLAVDRAGNLYVSDQLNFRIQVFDPSGAFVKKFGVSGDNIDAFEGPMGLAFDNLGQLWVADFRKAAIITYDVSGEVPAFLFATRGPSASKGTYCFYSPIDIYIDPSNRVYVSDLMGIRISVWQYLDKDYLAQHPIPPNWRQRTDLFSRWYEGSGLVPPKELPAGLITAPNPAK